MIEKSHAISEISLQSTSIFSYFFLFAFRLSVKMNLFDYLMCLIMGFRRRFNTIIFDLILMNGKTNDSLIVMAIVFIIIFLKS